MFMLELEDSIALADQLKMFFPTWTISNVSTSGNPI
jgi:hypothetical protein